MVERLLDYARIGVGSPKQTSVDLAECVAQAAEVTRAENPEATIRLNVSAAGRVTGDPVLLARLFLNLLQNALKFGRPGVRPEVDVEGLTDGDFALVAVTDNGAGVAPEKAEDIFKMFTRLEAETRASGFGMGLAICRRICETQRGSIVLDKTYAKGARFLVRLPRAVESPEG
jgi:signal transduction histidine kinase